MTEIAAQAEHEGAQPSAGLELSIAVGSSIVAALVGAGLARVIAEAATLAKVVEAANAIKVEAKQFTTGAQSLKAALYSTAAAKPSFSVTKFRQ